MKRVVLFLGAGCVLATSSALAIAMPAAAQDAGAPTPPATPDAGAATPAEGTPAEGTPAEGTPTPPTEGTPTEAQPTEGTPTEGTPTEAQPTEGTPTEGQSEGGAIETTEDEPEAAPAPPPSTGESEDTGEPDEEPAAPRPAWRNSTATLTHYVGAYSISPGLSDNPYFASELSLAARWYLTDDMWLRARWGFSVEWTQNDGEFVYASLTDYEQEPVVTDLRLDFNRAMVSIGDYKLAAAAGVRIPLSVASLANEMILGAYLTLSPTYSFPDVLAGLTLRASLTFDGRIYASDTRQLDSPIARERLEGTGSASNSSTGSFLAPYQSIEVIGADLQITPEFGVGADFTYWNLFYYQPPDTRYVMPVGGAVADPRGIPVESQSGTSWIHLWGVGVTATYQPVPWLGATLGYSALTQQTYGGGEGGGTAYRNPLWNYDSVVNLDIVFTPDQLLVPPQPSAEARRRARRVARSASPQVTH